jgi:hypothetical protein
MAPHKMGADRSLKRGVPKIPCLGHSVTHGVRAQIAPTRVTYGMVYSYSIKREDHGFRREEVASSIGPRDLSGFIPRNVSPDRIHAAAAAWIVRIGLRPSNGRMVVNRRVRARYLTRSVKTDSGAHPPGDLQTESTPLPPFRDPCQSRAQRVLPGRI